MDNEMTQVNGTAFNWIIYESKHCYRIARYTKYSSFEKL